MTQILRFLCTACTLVVVVVVWGCNSGSRDECGPSISELRATTAHADRASRKFSDYYLVEIAREVPGFGGVRTIPNPDGPDSLGIYMVEPDTAAAKRVREALAAHRFTNKPDPDSLQVKGELSRPIKILLAKYDYAQLHAWRGEMGRFIVPIPGVKGLLMRANELAVGIESDSVGVVRCTMERLTELSIPPDAVKFEVMGQIVLE